MRIPPAADTPCFVAAGLGGVRAHLPVHASDAVLMVHGQRPRLCAVLLQKVVGRRLCGPEAAAGLHACRGSASTTFLPRHWFPRTLESATRRFLRSLPGSSRAAGARSTSRQQARGERAQDGTEVAAGTTLTLGHRRCLAASPRAGVERRCARLRAPRQRTAELPGARHVRRRPSTAVSWQAGAPAESAQRVRRKLQIYPCKTTALCLVSSHNTAVRAPSSVSSAAARACAHGAAWRPACSPTFASRASTCLRLMPAPAPAPRPVLHGREPSFGLTRGSDRLITRSLPARGAQPQALQTATSPCLSSSLRYFPPLRLLSFLAQSADTPSARLYLPARAWPCMH